jgi:hypothetical protein
MIYLQDGPAETTGFMILGYAVIFGVLLLHVASLALRKRNLRRDYDLLKEIDK